MQDQGSWDDCPSGVVTEMAGQLRRRKRQAQLRTVASMGLAVLLFSAIGYGLANRQESSSRAGLNCREAFSLFVKYHDQSLDAAVASDVREHLSHCPKCRKHYEELYSGEVRTRSSVETRRVAVAFQFRH